MNKSNSSILYSLSKDITTQKIKGKKVDDVIKNISIFLENCTTGNIKKPSGINITSYSAYTDTENPKIAEDIKLNLTALFGEGKTAPVSYSYPSGEASHNTKTEWDVDNSNLEKAINFMAESRPWPKYSFGPVELLVSYFFLLIDPITKQILPHQDSNSSLMIWISNTAICSPTLDFPFESRDDFWNYLNKIEPFIPFELRRKYLRIVRPNRNKSGFTYRKLI